MARRRRRCFKVFIIVFVGLISTTYILLPPQKIENKAPTFSKEQMLHCSKLGDQVVAKSLTRYCYKRYYNLSAFEWISMEIGGIQNLTEFFLEVKELMSCPWTSNLTQQLVYKMDLHTKCNASGMLFVTRENTLLGQRLTYEAQRKSTKLVDKKLYSMLPKAAPWGTSRELGHCAVVGNGGILKNSSCGAKIDTADFVIRLNLAPIDYISDVGAKSSLVTVNPSQVTESFNGLCNERQPFVDKAAAHGNAYLAISPFSYVVSTDLSFRIFYTMKEMRPQQGVHYIHPDYLLMLDRYWRKGGEMGSRLSSGFMLMSVALELCAKVDLYGFWPFDKDLSQRPVSHHYYDNVPAKQGVHAMPMEFLKLMSLHRQGVLQLHVGECQ